MEPETWMCMTSGFTIHIWLYVYTYVLHQNHLLIGSVYQMSFFNNVCSCWSLPHPGIFAPKRSWNGKRNVKPNASWSELPWSARGSKKRSWRRKVKGKWLQLMDEWLEEYGEWLAEIESPENTCISQYFTHFTCSIYLLKCIGGGSFLKDCALWTHHRISSQTHGAVDDLGMLGIQIWSF